MDATVLKHLTSILNNAPRETEHHAVTGLWKTWNNGLYQLRLLDALLSLPSATLNFTALPGQKILVDSDVRIAGTGITDLRVHVQNCTWNSLELFRVLVRLAYSYSVETRTIVCGILDKGIEVSAELVHLGLLQVPVRSTCMSRFSLVGG